MQKVIATNRKAVHDYEVVKKYVAGVVLRGCEVKSVRINGFTFDGAWCTFSDGGLDALGCHIRPYVTGDPLRPSDPLRPKRLLLGKTELRQLRKGVEEKGMTIVPMCVFFNERNRLKMDIALCRGRKSYDKREMIKERDIKREMERHEI